MLLPMGIGQLDAVMTVETAAYEFPWSRGNFIDSIAAGYAAQVLYGAGGELLGYFVAMGGVDEMHLLNITTAPPHQHCGHARFMLDALVALCRRRGARRLWLEVRRSNLRAQSIYRRRGFAEVGARRGYYPAPQGQREDALVMSLDIGAGGERDALD
ncbi:MAG: ribosomal protein S18-alanine N-acetyltransferase [Piscinibacter sp.]|uniref:ribosomal protein S18-alanine N-acetyltransferase n=2 Tax=Piscinibacter TaxID=1114981 RepID=UPI00258346A6|nr:ribosomal protein S18-alanine N-acetyltransferase [Piscinibacter sp.]MCW5667640.1 ribosomal protein S18-alanine N-acetyltransferase [Piscinibacter sp.]